MFSLLLKPLVKYFILYSNSRPVTSLVKLSNSNLLASGSLDSTVKIWQIPNGLQLRTLRGHTAGVTTLVELKDYLVSGSEDKSIKFWKVDNGELIRTLEGHTAAIYNLARLSNGYLASSG